MAIKSKPKTSAASKKSSGKKLGPALSEPVSQISAVKKPPEVAVPTPSLPIPIQKAVLSPELLATVNTAQSAKVTPLVDEREKAREERRQKKLAEMEALRLRREAANAGVPADSSAPTRGPITPRLPRLAPWLVPPPTPATEVAGQTSAVAAAEKKTVTLTIPEALKYKLLYCESEHRTVAAPVIASLKAAAQAKLAADIAQAIKIEPKCKASADKMQVCVNEILDFLQPQLPDGYAVKFLRTEEGFAICNYDPESAGKRVQVA